MYNHITLQTQRTTIYLTVKESYTQISRTWEKDSTSV